MTDNTKMREAMIDQDGAVWEKIGGAWSLYKPAQSEPVEVFDSRCNYASFAGRVCNKCGRIHDGGKSVHNQRPQCVRVDGPVGPHGE